MSKKTKLALARETVYLLASTDPFDAIATDQAARVAGGEGVPVPGPSGWQSCTCPVPIPGPSGWRGCPNQKH